LPKCVEDLNTLPRSPENLAVRFAVEESDCGRVMRVAATFVSEPLARIFHTAIRKSSPSWFKQRFCRGLAVVDREPTF